MRTCNMGLYFGQGQFWVDDGFGTLVPNPWFYDTVELYFLFDSTTAH